MSDYVLNSNDQPTLHGMMQAMQYWDIASNTPIYTGPLPDGSGSYFLNEVGLTDTPGWWSRLRINGNNPFADGALSIPTGLTVYPPVQFLADGVTPDPTYTQPAYGVIA